MEFSNGLVYIIVKPIDTNSRIGIFKSLNYMKDDCMLAQKLSSVSTPRMHRHFNQHAASRVTTCL